MTIGSQVRVLRHLGYCCWCMCSLFFKFVAPKS